MSQLFDQDAAAPADGRQSPVTRAAKWLVGDRLACVLHLGDSEMAYRLSDQGHDVTVAGPDAAVVRDPNVGYVRTDESHLPFVDASFDAVVAPRLGLSAVQLQECARVLRPGGLLSSIERADDETIPWLRRLREIVGRRTVAPVDDAALASAPFTDPEVEDIATWEKLDRARLVQYARATGRVDLDDATIARVHELFAANAGHTGHLRLRQVTRCRRVRVVRDAVATSPPTQDTVLLDLR